MLILFSFVFIFKSKISDYRVIKLKKVTWRFYLYFENLLDIEQSKKIICSQEFFLLDCFIINQTKRDMKNFQSTATELINENEKIKKIFDSQSNFLIGLMAFAVVQYVVLISII